MRGLITLSILIVFFMILNIPLVSAAQPTNLLMEYEANYEQFTEVEIADKIVYYYQRMLGDAIVEKDFIVYQFDRDTGELLAKKTHWRDDLPERLPKIKISKKRAEAMVEGEVNFSKLYIISPESDVFPIEPTPENPCWVVRSIDNGNMIVTIIDAVTGKNLGYGIPPPYTAFAFSGPRDEHPCIFSWEQWYMNAFFWFYEMGYYPEDEVWPAEWQVKGHIQSDETAMFYEVAHGSLSNHFKSGCVNIWDYEITYASEIETWIADYKKMRFTFLTSCSSMCEIGPGTLSHAFRKGSNDRTVTVGYCRLWHEDCTGCWDYSLDWQDRLFNYMNQEWTVKAAFDQANADYPMCAGNDCTRFAGDQNFAVVPVVERLDCPPRSCQDLMDLVGAHWGSSCGQSGYNPVADVNKDKIIDVDDLNQVGGHCGYGDWCQGKLDDTTDPCISTTTAPTTTRSGGGGGGGGGGSRPVYAPYDILDALKQPTVIITVTGIIVAMFSVLQFTAEKKY